jgi:hypothetical protein
MTINQIPLRKARPGDEHAGTHQQESYAAADLGSSLRGSKETAASRPECGPQQASPSRGNPGNMLKRPSKALMAAR